MPRVRAPEKLIEEIPLRKLIGQTLAFSPESYSEELLKLLEETHAGSLIFVSRGVKSGNDARKLTESLQQTSEKDQHAIPLFICAEQEGGFYSLPPKATQFPSSMAVAASRSVRHCYDMAFALALELRSIGVNMNLAPTASLVHSSDDPLGIDSFGEDVALATKLASSFVRGLQHGGVSAAAKPFPVRCGAEQEGELVVPQPIDRLLSLDLKPFSECLRVGTDAVLIGRAKIPAVDPNEVSILSSRFVTGFLRNRLGFGGLIMADLRDKGAAKLDTRKALEAGNDLLIIDNENLAQASEEILAYARKSRVFTRRVKEAALRVLRLKSKRLNRFRRPSMATYGATLHLRLAQKIANESVTVARNAGNIPLKDERAILLVCPKLDESLETGPSALFDVMKKLGHQVRGCPVSLNPTREDVRRVMEEAKRSENLVICSIDGHRNKELAELIRRCLEINPAAIVVSMGNPHDLKLLPAQNCLATFGLSKPSMEATAGIILGHLKPSGTMPVNLS
jgi:beta-N-acetylhexosaminidase